MRGLEFRASGWFGCVCTFAGVGAALFVALLSSGVREK